jgi:hypothetical protein
MASRVIVVWLECTGCGSRLVGRNLRWYEAGAKARTYFWMRFRGLKGVATPSTLVLRTSLRQMRNAEHAMFKKQSTQSESGQGTNADSLRE